MDSLLHVVVPAAVAVTVAGLTVWAGRRREKADASESVTRATMLLLAPLERRIDTLEDENRALHQEMTELKAENAALHRWSQVLFAQVLDNGGTPLPFDSVAYLEGDG